MRYDIFGKKIVGITSSSDEFNIRFDDGVSIIIKAKAHVHLKSDGALRVSPSLQVTTDKVELTAVEG